MAKARIRQQPLNGRVAQQVNVVNKTIGSQKDRTKGELARLRELLKVQSRAGAGKKTQAVLEQIKTRYGDKQLQKAIREFNITFRGIERDPEEGKRPPTKTLPATGPKGR
jgi:hypothetical protein